MNLEELKKIITNYNPAKALQTTEENPNYISVLAVEQVLKAKQLELEDKIKEFTKHVSKLLKKDCSFFLKNESPTPIRSHQHGRHSICLKINDSIFSDKKTRLKLTQQEENRLQSSLKHEEKSFFNPKYRYYQLLANDPKTQEFLEYYTNYCQKYCDHNGLKTNIGLYLDLFQNEMDGLQIIFSDRSDIDYIDYNTSYNVERFLEILEIRRYGTYDFYGEYPNFFFHKDIIANTRTLKYNNDACKDFLNESQIANIYNTLKVDISSFPKEVQEEMRRYEGYYQLKINEHGNQDKNELLRLQRERLIDAYQKLKEVAELLNNLPADISLEKIKIEHLETFFFKKNGQPNEHGYIEIDDLFRNNNLLRLIDLKDIDLTNVDIRNMDFSGTNIRFNPQQVYNKDLTNVNADGIKFSPFTDSFDNVTLDGAIITDWEANINLDKLKSYNNQTVFPQHEKYTK